MEHLTKEVLERYLNKQLYENEQERVENHMYNCDDCSNVYLELIDSHTLTNTVSEDFTDQTVSKIISQNHIPQKLKQPYQTKTNKVIGHYFLAAGLTIVLMLTGVFQGALDITNDNNQVENRISVTDQLMQSTNTLLDQMKGEHK